MISNRWLLKAILNCPLAVHLLLRPIEFAFIWCSILFVCLEPLPRQTLLVYLMDLSRSENEQRMFRQGQFAGLNTTANLGRTDNSIRPLSSTLATDR